MHPSAVAEGASVSIPPPRPRLEPHGHSDVLVADPRSNPDLVAGGKCRRESDTGQGESPVATRFCIIDSTLVQILAVGEAHVLGVVALVGSVDGHPCAESCCENSQPQSSSPAVLGPGIQVVGVTDDFAHAFCGTFLAESLVDLTVFRGRCGWRRRHRSCWGADHNRRFGFLLLLFQNL